MTAPPRAATVEAGGALAPDLPAYRSEALDRLSRLAAAIMDAPIAHVTLVAGDRQYYSGSHGLPPEVISPDGLPLTFGFCPTVVATGAPLRRTDLTNSEFRDNPAVVDHGARAYAGTPLRTAAGTVVGSLCVVDLEPREWLEERLVLLDELASSVITELELVRALLDAEDRAEATRVIRHLHEGVVLVDEQRAVRVWNPAAAAITGVDAGDALGRPIDEVVPGWPVSGAPAGRVRLERGSEVRTLEVGGAEWSGRAVYALRDVTADEQLAAMRDELVATISHELRTPLASIYAAAITLQRPELRLDHAMTTTLLAVVEQQATRLTELCDAVLLATRLDNGPSALRREPVDLALLLDELDAEFAVRPDRAGRLLLDVPPGSVAAADAAALRRVVANVLDNACKYSPDDVAVHVRVERLGPNRIELVVEDDGTGIPIADRELVFQKFYRRDPHMRDGVGGTGLGLHIARALVEGMGGSMSLGDATADRTGLAVHVALDAW